MRCQRARFLPYPVSFKYHFLCALISAGRRSTDPMRSDIHRMSRIYAMRVEQHVVGACGRYRRSNSSVRATLRRFHKVELPEVVAAKSSCWAVYYECWRICKTSDWSGPQLWSPVTLRKLRRTSPRSTRVFQGNVRLKSSRAPSDPRGD